MFSEFIFPTESRKEANRATKGCAIFCGTAERRKLAFVSDDGAQKTASASAECRFASVSMMARGGREKASQRLNPESHETASQPPERLIFYNLGNIWTTSLTILPCCHFTFLLNISSVGCANHIQQ